MTGDITGKRLMWINKNTSDLRYVCAFPGSFLHVEFLDGGRVVGTYDCTGPIPTSEEKADIADLEEKLMEMQQRHLAHAQEERELSSYRLA